MAPDSLIGKKIANFRIERLIGRGGMAKVYFAWDEKLLRPVAVKVIGESYRSDPEYKERFIREAAFVSTWHHPNILQVYSAGEENGLYYYVMEYVPGRDLSQVLQELKSRGELLPAYEVLRVARAVAGALDYAHQRGVIHRDVKPSNVLMVDDHRIILTDFGLAMNINQGTMGVVFGSPHYISPEQAKNSAQAVAQSDLYSLGVMLYEMLTGAVPFDDPHPAALAFQHISSPPPPPRSLNPRLNPAEEAVLLKALAKAPLDRYPTGEALAAALGGAMNEGVASTQPWPGPAAAAANPASAVLPNGRAFQAAQAPPVYPPTMLPGVPARAAGRPGAGRGWIFGCAGLLVALAFVGFLFMLGQGLVSGSFFRRSTSTPAPTHPQKTLTVAATPLALVPPSATPSPEPTGTGTPAPTDTQTPTPTDTLTPTPTPDQGSVSFFVPPKTQALLVLNGSDVPLSLQNLSIRSGSAQIQGDAWNAITLAQGECALVLGDSRDASRVGQLSCSQPAGPLRWTGETVFWLNRFDVYLYGQHAGTCTKLPDHDSGCTVNFILPTATPTPTPTDTGTASYSTTPAVPPPAQ